jgi:hypothetical protein
MYVVVDKLREKVDLVQQGFSVLRNAQGKQPEVLCLRRSRSQELARYSQERPVKRAFEGSLYSYITV